MWAGNIIAARLAVGGISPMVITCGRWAIAAMLLAAVGGRRLAADWAVVGPRWPRVVIGGACGFTLFNALFYVAARHTSGVNLAILQAIVPLLVFIGGRLFLGTTVRPVQAMGLLLTTAGVLVVAARGDIATLLALRFSAGDLYMLVASFMYAAYVLLLRDRPRISALGFFTILAIVAFLTSLPLLAVEIAASEAVWPHGWDIAIILYIALFPSLLAQIFFIRGVELVGANRAGIFYNLVPVFGALLSVALLGETFAPYHVVALVLTIGGIFIAERQEHDPEKSNGFSDEIMR